MSPHMFLVLQQIHLALIYSSIMPLLLYPHLELPSTPTHQMYQSLTLYLSLHGHEMASELPQPGRIILLGCGMQLRLITSCNTTNIRVRSNLWRGRLIILISPQEARIKLCGYGMLSQDQTF